MWVLCQRVGVVCMGVWVGGYANGVWIGCTDWVCEMDVVVALVCDVQVYPPFKRVRISAFLNFANSSGTYGLSSSGPV